MSSKHRFVFKLIYLYNPLLANFFKHVCLVFFSRKETQRCYIYSSGLHVSVQVQFRLRLFTNTQFEQPRKINSFYITELGVFWLLSTKFSYGHWCMLFLFKNTVSREYATNYKTWFLGSRPISRVKVDNKNYNQHFIKHNEDKNSQF